LTVREVPVILAVCCPSAHLFMLKVLMSKSALTLLLGLLLQSVFLQAGLPRIRVFSGETSQAAVSAREALSQVAAPKNPELDSLHYLTDSLARAADSLAALVDSLISPADRAAEPAPPEPVPQEKVEKDNRWSGTFGMGLTLNRGNSDQRSLVSNLRVNRPGDKTRFSSSATVTDSREHLGTSTNKESLKSKYELDQTKRFFYFATLDMYYNRQEGLNMRLAPGMGVGFAILAKTKCRLNLNLGANPITEYRRNEPRRTHGHFLGSQDFRIDLNSHTRLEQNMTYKPRFDRLNDYLLTFEVSLTNQLTSAFDLKLNLEGIFNSRPPKHDPPYKRQDWMFYTAIGYNIW